MILATSTFVRKIVISSPEALQRFEHPNQAWVGDITHIPTEEGWLYLAAVRDLCTKKVVGYAFPPQDRHTACSGCPEYGSIPGASWHRADLPQRERRTVCFHCFSFPFATAGNSAKHVPKGRSLRQRCRGEFLQLSEM